MSTAVHPGHGVDRPPGAADGPGNECPTRLAQAPKVLERSVAALLEAVDIIFNARPAALSVSHSTIDSHARRVVGMMRVSV